MPNAPAPHANPPVAAPIVNGIINAHSSRFQEKARSIMLFVIRPGSRVSTPTITIATAAYRHTAITPPARSLNPATSHAGSGNRLISESSANTIPDITASLITSLHGPETRIRASTTRRHGPRPITGRKEREGPTPGEGRGAVKESGPPAYGNKEKKNHAPAGPGTP